MQFDPQHFYGFLGCPSSSPSSRKKEARSPPNGSIAVHDRQFKSITTIDTLVVPVMPHTVGVRVMVRPLPMLAMVDAMIDIGMG